MGGSNCCTNVEEVAGKPTQGERKKAKKKAQQVDRNLQNLAVFDEITNKDEKALDEDEEEQDE